MEKQNDIKKRIDSKKIAYAIILVAAGIALSPFTSFQIGIAKVNPTQHLINLVAAVILGPYYAVVIATIMAIIRNILGVGTILAFPGGMIGALSAGLAYKLSKNIYISGIGEVFGTGIIASFFCSYIIAPFIMHKAIGVMFLLSSFIISSIIGNIIGVISIKILEKNNIIKLQ